jgi:hydrogenase-4 component B
MFTLLVLLLFCYIAGCVLPLCVPHSFRAQNLLAHGFAGAASLLGIGLGVSGLVASKPLTLSFPSSIPYLDFTFRLDALAAFFVLTISLVGFAVAVYASGYVTKFYGRTSVGVLGALFNGFLLSMTLVVLADNGFFFLIVWELMSLLSYFLVVTEHEKADVRYAGFFYLIMTHIGISAWCVLS